MPMPAASATARSSVDLPVPGGPSRTMWRPASRAAVRTSASRRRPTMSRPIRSSRSLPSVFVKDDPADVLAVEQVLVALVDVVEPVRLGDQLVELDVAAAVQVEHLL